jgi:hypothetical protein
MLDRHLELVNAVISLACSDRNWRMAGHFSHRVDILRADRIFQPEGSMFINTLGEGNCFGWRETAMELQKKIHIV